MEKEINYDNIIDFYDEFSIGVLSPSFKSEEITNSDTKDINKIHVYLKKNDENYFIFFKEISCKKF